MSLEKTNPKESNTLDLETEKFGKITVEKENVVDFEDGIVGFEDLKQFVIVNIEECRPFEWLISIENPTVAFPIINPVPFFTDYNPIKSIGDISPLNTKDGKNIETFCVVTLGDKPENVTVNLKGPILVNMEKKIGKQFIMAEDYYNLHHPLVRK